MQREDTAGEIGLTSNFPLHVPGPLIKKELGSRIALQRAIFASCGERGGGGRGRFVLVVLKRSTHSSRWRPTSVEWSESITPPPRDERCPYSLHCFCCFAVVEQRWRTERVGRSSARSALRERNLQRGGRGFEVKNKLVAVSVGWPDEAAKPGCFCMSQHNPKRG